MQNFGKIHNFTFTDKSVVFLIPPSEYDQDHAAGAPSFLVMHRGHLDQAVNILVIETSTLELP